MNVFETKEIQNKIQGLETHIQSVLSGRIFHVPDLSARDLEVREPLEHPPKKGLSSKEGQARLLHDLASIELQAMELALRTLTEYHHQIKGTQYLDLLVQLVLSERSHLQLCLNGIRDLGFEWGHWPVHMALWKAVAVDDTLIERVFIVHRFLEGSGLDAADTLLRRLSGVDGKHIDKIVKTISTEEMDHVQFGSQWFFDLCKREKLDADSVFKNTLYSVRVKLPKRLEPINSDLRQRALFTVSEIETLKAFQSASSKS